MHLGRIDQSGLDGGLRQAAVESSMRTKSRLMPAFPMRRLYASRNLATAPPRSDQARLENDGEQVEFGEVPGLNLEFDIDEPN